MANEVRLIDACQFRGKHKVAEVNGKLSSVILYGDIVNAPTVDAVEVVRIEETKRKILQVMDEFIADWLGITQSYTDIFRAKIDAMETAKRLVNAALNDLCDNGGAKMDGDGNG